MRKTNKPTPATNSLLLKKEKALATKQADLLKARLTETIRASNVLSKEDLDSAYDPADPASTQKAIDAHNAKVDALVDEALTSIETEATTYIGEEYSDDKIELQSSLAVFNTANKQELTYEQLTNDIPPRIMKEYTEGKLTHDQLFEASTQYLQTQGGVYNPTTPHDHTDGNAVPATIVDGDTTQADGEEYY